MRLGQLARKYNLNQEEVILLLNEAQAELSPFHHNSKLSDDMEALIIDKFSLSSEEIKETTEEEAEEVIEKPIEDIPIEAKEEELEVNEIELEFEKKTEADLQRELDPTLPQVKHTPIEKEDENSIDTDRLLQLLEADETPNDLSKITHIKAPKKELSGLKVVGKIQLAEPKIKSVEQTELQETESKTAGFKRQDRQRLNEERSNRRLQEKKKKEQYEAREEKRRIEGEKRQRKAQNKVRYEEKMQKANAARAKQIIQKEDLEEDVNDQAQLPTYKPMTIFDKFWNLFNL